MIDVNESYGFSQTKRTHNPCRTCGSFRPNGELNWEGRSHHGTKVECIDRQACERRKRKAKRRSK